MLRKLVSSIFGRRKNDGSAPGESGAPVTPEEVELIESAEPEDAMSDFDAAALLAGDTPLPAAPAPVPAAPAPAPAPAAPAPAPAPAAAAPAPAPAATAPAKPTLAERLARLEESNKTTAIAADAAVSKAVGLAVEKIAAEARKQIAEARESAAAAANRAAAAVSEAESAKAKAESAKAEAESALAEVAFLRSAIGI